MTARASIRGWHFAKTTLRDGRKLPRKGTTLRHDGEVIPCQSGLHFSERAIDALEYAPGTFVALVEGPPDALPHGSPTDKRCGAWRKNLTPYVDSAKVLHRFACWCATRAMDREEAAEERIDPRSREAVRVKLAWLDGKATDEELLAAGAAAMCGAAAGTAAWASSRASAWDAARDAAWDAAWDAARGAARDAERIAQNTQLESMLLELLGVK